MSRRPRGPGPEERREDATLMVHTRFYCGVDGGATKTWAVVGDGEGRLVGFGTGGPANYHLVGLEAAMQAVRRAVDGALSQAGLELGALARACFCLAADDSPEDHERIGRALAAMLPESLPFTWDNDSWAGLRGGTDKPWGAVVIGGTSTNSAAKAPDGSRAILRGLGRQSGNPGGSADIAIEAVFWALRMDEGSAPKTRLHGEILKALGLPDYDALIKEHREGGLAFSYRAMGVVTPLVFRLASEGDERAQDVLIRVGRWMGEQTGAVMRRVGIDGLESDVVLAGSVFRGENPLLIDSLTLHLHCFAPRARTRLPLYHPVIGAYLLALEADGLEATPALYEKIEETRDILPEPGPVTPGGLE